MTLMEKLPHIKYFRWNLLIYGVHLLQFFLKFFAFLQHPGTVHNGAI